MAFALGFICGMVVEFTILLVVAAIIQDKRDDDIVNVGDSDENM